MIEVRVGAIEQLTRQVRVITLEPCSGMQLPAFEPGSHVEVHLSCDGRIERSAYSLIGSAARRDAYQIVVRVRPESGRVSRWLHDVARPGSTVKISEPRCGLRLAPRARRHVLIAGGVGVTAFLSHLSALRERGADYHLYYTFRYVEQGILAQHLAEEHGMRVTIRVSSEQGRFPLGRILRAQPHGTHLYVCGPSALMQSVFDRAREAGLGTDRIHWDSHAWSPAPERQAERMLAGCRAVALAT